MAVISGGAEVTRGLQKNITLNASLSYDPEVAHGNRSGMKFTWHYGKVARNHSSKQAEAKADKDFFMAVNESAIHYNRNASGELVSLNTEALSVNQTYIVKLVLTKDSRISTVYQVIHLIEGDPPEIYQRLGSTLSLLLISLFGLFLQLFSLPLLIPIFALDPAIAFIFYCHFCRPILPVLFLGLLFFVVSACVFLYTLLSLSTIMLLFALTFWLLLLLQLLH